MRRLSSVEAHTIWAPIYDSTLNPLVALERRTLTALLRRHAPRSVVDVGCGTGQWLERFQTSGANVFGLDACEPMLVQAKMRATALAGRLVQGNAQRLPYASSTADLVLCSMSLGYFENLSAIFKEFARVARPGGSVAVTDVHPDAIAAGWKRSFRSGDVFCEIEHFYYPVETIREAAFRAGLHLLAWADAKLGYPEFPIFRQAGKAQLFHHATKRPALFLAVWERPC